MKDNIYGTNGLKWKFSALYFLACGAMACYYPFMLVYYQSRNLNYSQIGSLFAINSLVAVIAQPLWGILADKYLGKKRTFFMVLAASTAVILGFVKADSFATVAFSVILFMVFQSPALSINDAYCCEAVEVDKSLQYGKLRLMGSVGYAVIALLLAYLIERTSIETSFFVYAMFGLLSMLVLSRIHVKGKSSASSINLKDVTDILKNKKFLILCLSAMLTSACMNANGSYIATLIQSTGGNTSNIGLLWFVVAMAELPAFYFGGQLMGKYGSLNVYLTGLLFYSCRFLLDSLCASYQLVIALQMMQAITYPLYIMSTLQYVNSIVPFKTRTTAITVFAAFTAGIGGVLGNMAGASIIKSSSVFMLFRLMSVMVLVAFGIGIFLKFEKSTGEKSRNE